MVTVVYLLYVLPTKRVLWAMSKTWPIPLPVHCASKMLPVFFSTSGELGLPCVNLDAIISPYSASNVTLIGALCFSLRNFSNSCIWLKNGSLGNWLDPLCHNQVPLNMPTEVLSQVTTDLSSGSGSGFNGTSTTSVTTLLMLMEGLRPSNSYYFQQNSTSCQVLPFCAPNLSYPPHWTTCQSPDRKLLQISPGFQFSPPLEKYSYNFTKVTNLKTAGKNGWPWFQWILSNDRGAFTTLEPMAALDGITT